MLNVLDKAGAVVGEPAATAVNVPTTLVYSGLKEGVLRAPVGEFWEMGDALPVNARTAPTRALVVEEYFILKALLGLSEGKCRRFSRYCVKDLENKKFEEQKIRIYSPLISGAMEKYGSVQTKI
jgi:hypothetical protein